MEERDDGLAKRIVDHDLMLEVILKRLDDMAMDPPQQDLTTELN